MKHAYVEAAFSDAGRKLARGDVILDMADGQFNDFVLIKKVREASEAEVAAAREAAAPKPVARRARRARSR